MVTEQMILRTPSQLIQIIRQIPMEMDLPMLMKMQQQDQIKPKKTLMETDTMTLPVTVTKWFCLRIIMETLGMNLIGENVKGVGNKIPRGTGNIPHQHGLKMNFQLTTQSIKIQTVMGQVIMQILMMITMAIQMAMMIFLQILQNG